MARAVRFMKKEFMGESIRLTSASKKQYQIVVNGVVRGNAAGGGRAGERCEWSAPTTVPPAPTGIVCFVFAAAGQQRQRRSASQQACCTLSTLTSATGSQNLAALFGQRLASAVDAADAVQHGPPARVLSFNVVRRRPHLRRRERLFRWFAFFSLRLPLLLRE